MISISSHRKDLPYYLKYLNILKSITRALNFVFKGFKRYKPPIKRTKTTHRKDITHPRKGLKPPMERTLNIKTSHKKDIKYLKFPVGRILNIKTSQEKDLPYYLKYLNILKSIKELSNSVFKGFKRYGFPIERTKFPIERTNSSHRKDINFPSKGLEYSISSYGKDLPYYLTKPFPINGISLRMILAHMYPYKKPIINSLLCSYLKDIPFMGNNNNYTFIKTKDLLCQKL